MLRQRGRDARGLSLTAIGRQDCLATEAPHLNRSSAIRVVLAMLQTPVGCVGGPIKPEFTGGEPNSGGAPSAPWLRIGPGGVVLGIGVTLGIAGAVLIALP